jgi:hypothetical protein
MWQDSQLKTSTTQLISLAGFPARSTTRLLVPFQYRDSAYVVNADELGLSVKSYFNLEPERGRFLLTVGAPTLATFLLFVGIAWLGSHYSKKYFDALLKKLQALEENTHEELQALNRRSAHSKALLVRRLTDCRLELDFWRDTVRGALGPKSVGVADRIISSVTHVLGTYSTQERTRGSMDEVLALGEALAAENAAATGK